MDSAAGREADTAHVMEPSLGSSSVVLSWEERGRGAGLFHAMPPTLPGGQEARKVCGWATSMTSGALVGRGNHGTLQHYKWRRKPPGLASSSKVTASRSRAWEPHTHTHPNPQGTWLRPLQEHSIPGDARAQAREAGSNVLTFRGHRILFTSMLCSSTRAVCPSLGELGLTHTS